MTYNRRMPTVEMYYDAMLDLMNETAEKQYLGVDYQKFCYVDVKGRIIEDDDHAYFGIDIPVQFRELCVKSRFEPEEEREKIVARCRKDFLTDELGHIFEREEENSDSSEAIRVINPKFGDPVECPSLEALESALLILDIINPLSGLSWMPDSLVEGIDFEFVEKQSDAC